MNPPSNRFNVIEILYGAKKGTIAVVPCFFRHHRLSLRRARFLLCNVSLEYARGFAGGYPVGYTHGHLTGYSDCERAARERALKLPAATSLRLGGTLR
jgi:hypothetical protein